MTDDKRGKRESEKGKENNIERRVKMLWVLIVCVCACVRACVCVCVCVYDALHVLTGECAVRSDRAAGQGFGVSISGVLILIGFF